MSQSPFPILHSLFSTLAALREQLQDFSGARMPIELRLLEDGSAVAQDFEAALARRNHLDLGGGIRCADLGRQTDGPRFVVSKRAVLD
jgi:hypothetical protein